MTTALNRENSKLTIQVEGRLDTTTAPQLEDTIKNNTEGIETVVFDFAKLEYISSAGLRVLLSAKKMLGTSGSIIVRNANEVITEVFEITGFSDIVTIE